MESLTDQLWDLLWDEVEGSDDFPNLRPLLAHYTSAVTAEAILKGKQLWLSHPILMNDVEELQWGIQASRKIIFEHEVLESSCGGFAAFEKFINYFQSYVDDYDRGDARSIFIACFSRHGSEDRDGLLSMWRAYGSNGEGVAIVFDTSKIEVQEDSPFVLGPVNYCQPGDREKLIKKEVDKVAKFFEKNSDHFGDDFFRTSAYYLLQKIKQISLTTKHYGFREENEWRLIYFPERDQGNAYQEFIGYASGVTGFQPKLKIPIGGKISWIPGLSDMVSEIILGPSHGSVLALDAFKKMLESGDLHALTSKVHRSTIPFRSRSF